MNLAKPAGSPSGLAAAGRAMLGGDAAILESRQSGEAEKAIRAAFARATRALPECGFALATFDGAGESLFEVLASERVDARVVGLIERHAARKTFRDRLAGLSEGRGFADLLNTLEPGLAAFARPVNSVVFAQAIQGEAGAMLAVMKPAEYGLFSPPDHGLILETAQFVFSALRIRAGVAAGAMAELSESLSRLDVAFLAVDGALRLAHANGAAERCLASGEYIRHEGGAVSLADAAADARLRQLVEHLSGRHKADAAAIAMTKPDGGNELVRLVVSTVRDCADALLGPPLFALTFAPEKKTAAVESADLRRFGLSAAETELALDLLKGATVSQRAAHRGIAVATARAHLKRAMMRLGVKRQADLIRHLMSVL